MIVEAIGRAIVKFAGTLPLTHAVKGESNAIALPCQDELSEHHRKCLG